MGMNVNRGFFNLDPNWKDKVKPDLGREMKELKPDPIEPGMQPKPRIPSQKEISSLEDILNNLDYKGFGQ